MRTMHPTEDRKIKTFIHHLPIFKTMLGINWSVHTKKIEYFADHKLAKEEAKDTILYGCDHPNVLEHMD